jgi:hypothetical protein
MNIKTSETSTGAPVINRATMTRRILMTTMAASATIAAAPSIAQAAAAADAELLELEEQIFESHEAATAHDTEINRLNDIVGTESVRLYDEVFVHRRSNLTEKERWAIATAMPESKEHDRLVELVRPHHDRLCELIERMWAIPATTPEGRQAKFFVLLNFVLGDDWREADGAADWHIEMARRMMIEFIGGEPAKQLRAQFARR